MNADYSASLNPSGASGACVTVRNPFPTDKSAMKSSASSPLLTKEMIEEALEDGYKYQADNVGVPAFS